jgi:hemerythrin
MRQGGFPELAHHLDLHAQFRADVRRMRAEWAADDNPDLQAEIAAELSRWLIGHIQGADRAYIPWIRKNRVEGRLAALPLPHHRTYGSVYGGSRSVV